MTKQETLEAALAICEEHEVVEGAVAALTELLRPKKGGGSFNIDDVVLRDENDAIYAILDSIFGVFIPVYDDAGEENFYSKPDTELAWSRFSKAAEKSRKDREKVFKATEKAVFADVLGGKILPEEGKALMDEAQVVRTTVVIPDGLDYIKPETDESAA